MGSRIFSFNVLINCCFFLCAPLDLVDSKKWKNESIIVFHAILLFTLAICACESIWRHPIFSPHLFYHKSASMRLFSLFSKQYICPPELRFRQATFWPFWLFCKIFHCLSGGCIRRTFKSSVNSVNFSVKVCWPNVGIFVLK